LVNIILDKDRIIVISKSDLIDKKRKDEISLEISKKIKNIPFDFISSVSNQGLVELKDDLWKVLNP
jgi:GTP-binding protein